MDPTSQNATVTTGCLVKPICFNSLSDCLAVDAMIGRQKIGSPIFGKIIQQSARAEVRPPIIVENDSCNGIFLGVAEACRVNFTNQNVGFIGPESPI
jgi:hypothetical protein